MAVKASVTITISKYRDTDSITRYYKLQASTATAPAVPTTLTPSGWSTSEPTYTSGSTNTLYYTDCIIFSDGTFQYTDDGNGKAVKSSSYEAAKEAYNKAQAAQNTANTTQENLDNLEIGGRNLIEKTNQGKNFWYNNINTSIYNTPISEEIEWLGTKAYKITSNGKKDESSAESWAVLQFKDPNGQNKLEVSSYYVISFDTSYPASISTIRFCRGNGQEEMFQNVSMIKNETRIDENGDNYYHYEVLCYTKSNFDNHISNDSYFYMSIVNLVSNTNAVAKYANLKMEKGNKATDWTPAPEDIQSELNTSISNLNTNINSRIDDTEGMIDDLSGIVDTKIDAATANTIAQDKVNDFLKSSAWLDISGLDGAIRALTNSDDGTYQILEQKDGEWTFQLGKLFTDVKSAIDDITKAKNQLNGSTESTLSKRIDQLDNDTKYIRMTTYQGQPAIILGMQNNFILLESQPDDWNSNYKEYYILDGNNYVHVTGDTAPTWQPNTYYQLSKSKFEVRITNTSMDFLEDGNRIAYVNNNAFYNTVGVVREEIKIVNNNQGFSWKTRSNGNLGLQWVEET